MYGEYVDEDLPLPPFREVFAFALRPPIQSTANLNRKRAYSKSNSQLSFLGNDSFDNDHKQSKSKKQKDINAEESTGRWSAEEHKLFLQGIMLYGKDWKKMQPLIKTRSLVQIRTHAQKVFKKIGLKKLDSHPNGGLGANDPSMKQLQDYLQKSVANSSAVNSANTSSNNIAVQSSSGTKAGQHESKEPTKSTLQLNASNVASSTTAAMKSPTAMSSSSGVSDGSKAPQAQSSHGAGSMIANQIQSTDKLATYSRIGVPSQSQTREEPSAMKSFYQNPSQQTTNTIPTQLSTSSSNNLANGINTNVMSSSFYNVPSSRSSSQYSPNERNPSINNNNNNNKSNNNISESTQVPPSPLPSDYLQMIHGTPVSEEDLRLLQQLSDMKEILNDDDDDNPDDEDDLGDDEDQPHHTHPHVLYSKSISYDDEDGGVRGHLTHHSFHPNSSFSSYINGAASSSHQQQLQQQHGYSMISNYPNHLGIEGSHGAMLPSYGQNGANGGTGGWSAADYLNNDATHLSAGNMSASQIYSHLSNMTAHHNGYENPNSFYSSSSNNANNNNQQRTNQHPLYHSSSLLPSVSGGSGLTDSGGLDSNYLIALQSDHSNASYDTAGDVNHQSSHAAFLQFLQSNNGLSHQSHEMESNEMMGGSRDNEEEDDDEEMRGDDADPIIALANRYSMIPHHSPMNNGNNKTR